MASASSFNPLGWVRDKIAPQIKEKQTKEEVEAAKKQAAEQGTRSVFDVQPIAKPSKGDDIRVSVKKGAKKAPPKEVRLRVSTGRASN